MFSSPILLCPSACLFWPVLTCLFCFGSSSSAPGCDQRLQLRVYAALQLDSRHCGPQPQRCVQPHSLWVRAALLSASIYLTPGTLKKQHHDAEQFRALIEGCSSWVCSHQRGYVQPMLQRGCREAAGLWEFSTAAAAHTLSSTVHVRIVDPRLCACPPWLLPFIWLGQ